MATNVRNSSTSVSTSSSRRSSRRTFFFTPNAPSFWARRYVGGLTVGLLALAVLAGCASGGSNVDRPGNESFTVPEGDATTTTSETSTIATTAPAADCTPAAEGDVAAIEAALAGGAVALVDARTVTIGDLRIVVADVADASGAVLSSADAWVFDGPVPYAVTSSARGYSSLLDGRDLVSPGDPAIAALFDC